MDIGEQAHPFFKIGNDSFHARLLQHNLRDPHCIRGWVAAPGESPFIGVVPSQEPGREAIHRYPVVEKRSPKSPDFANDRSRWTPRCKIKTRSVRSVFSLELKSTSCGNNLIGEVFYVIEQLIL